MRLGKTIALALAVLLVSNTLSACNFLRTPYERAKIAENGGVAKKKSDEGGDTGGGGGEAKTQSKEAQKKKEENKKPVDPNRAESQGEYKERMKGQGLLYIGADALKRKAAETKQEVKVETAKTAQKGQGALNLPKKTAEDKTPELSYDQKLSTAVSSLEGVGAATVLLDDEHRAYVGLSTDQAAKRGEEQSQTHDNAKYMVKTAGEISDDLQQRIAVKLRAMDPQVGIVHITNDPRHVDTVQRYAVKTADGSADDITTQALAEHIQDIWK